MLGRSLAVAVLLALAPRPVPAGDEVDLKIVNQIRDEGFRRSEVLQTLQHLTDVIGPRLTASPALHAANDWTLKKLTGWGLHNPKLEAFEFGRGWSFTRTAVHMLRPHAVPLLALPNAWTPGTAGPVHGLVTKTDIETEADFDRFRGRLKGRVVLLDEASAIKAPEDAFVRYSDKQLEDLEEYSIPDGKVTAGRAIRARQYRFLKKLYRFLGEQGVLAAVTISSRDAGLVRVMGYTYKPGEAPAFPVLVMAVEHYNRILRLLEDDIEVELEVDVRAQFHDGDTMSRNTIAEIPGTDKSGEVVMAGAHLDSWHASTGAVDNGSGSAVVMEAARILAAIGVKPKRTIRFALWSGEEQGLLGSRAYVEEHFARRPEPEDPAERELPRWMRENQGWPIEIHPAHQKLSAYFNLDNGSGKIRGIYAESNSAATPIFNSWFKPFQDLGAGTETLRHTGGTDHLSFDDVGLPGFQFIQDPLDYGFRLHHTNIDGYDHIQPDDLKQASVILASFLYNAAMATERFPRKPMPVPPTAKIKAREDKDKDKAHQAHEREQRRQSLPEHITK